MSYTKKAKISLLHSVCVADYRIILGKIEVESEPDLFFCTARDLVAVDEPPSDFTLKNSRKEIVDAYTALVAQNTKQIANFFLDKDAQGIRVARYCKEDCASPEDVDFMYDKVLVLDPDALMSDYETGSDQLVYCVKEPVNEERGDFILLLSGDDTYAYADDIIGVLRDEDVPEWAQESLTRLRERLGQEDEW